MKIKITKLTYHRNGVAGSGFHVALFTWRDGGRKRSMVATVFSDSGNLAVLDIGETARGNVEFAMGNSWRGDDFESTLRAAIVRQREIWLANPSGMMGLGKSQK